MVSTSRTAIDFNPLHLPCLIAGVVGQSSSVRTSERDIVRPKVMRLLLELREQTRPEQLKQLMRINLSDTAGMGHAFLSGGTLGGIAGLLTGAGLCGAPGMYVESSQACTSNHTHPHSGRISHSTQHDYACMPLWPAPA